MQDRTENPVIIDRIALITCHDQVITWNENETSNENDDLQGHINQDPNTNRQYAVDHIVRQLEIPRERRYAISWYGYTEEEDPTRPAENIPRHSRDNCWQLVHKQKSTVGQKRKHLYLPRTEVQTKHRTLQGKTLTTTQPTYHSKKLQL